MDIETELESIGEKPYYPLIAVAAVDVLGMRNIINIDDKCITAMSTLEKFIEQSMHNTLYMDKFLKKPLRKLYKKADLYADSVYLYGDTNTSIIEQVQSLVAMCASLITFGLEYGFLLRVGIATGDLRFSVTYPPNGGKMFLKIGNSMAKAQHIQESQKWIGGAIERGILKTQTDKSHVDYNVPIKENSGLIDKLEAINWVFLVARGINKNKRTEREIIDLIEKQVLSISNPKDKETEEKISNTIDFVKYIFSHSQYMPPEY